MKSVAGIVFLGIVLAVLTCCAPKEERPWSPPEDAVLAVAGFSQPQHSKEFIDHVGVDRKKIEPDVLKQLDSDLRDLIRQSEQEIIGPEIVAQCEKSFEDIGSYQSALDYWVQVGECVSADFILVPFVFKWEERLGGSWGVQEPAAVTLELNLIDVQKQRHESFLFDKRQYSLLEDLTQAGSFFRRGGKWISARELAQEGLERGVRGLGL